MKNQVRVATIVILIAILALFALILVWNRFNKFSPLSKSCETDSDCVIESADLCGFLCYPHSEDVYNQETATMIKKWREKQGREWCPLASCMALPIDNVAKCVSNVCTIETTVSCNNDTGTDICSIRDEYSVSSIEKMSRISISEAKRICNCS